MLNIDIRKAKKVPGIYSCFLTFSEYNQSWIEVIRQFNTRKYDDTTKTWEFPLYNLQDLVERYKNVAIHIHWQKDKSIEQVKVPQLNLKRKLFAHQETAVEYGLMHPKYLLLDTMGLGKTTSIIAEAIALKKLNKIKQCLIVCCVSDLQYNWAKEIETVCDETYFILGTRYRKKKGNAYAGQIVDRVDDLTNHDEFFLITNKETFQNEKFVKILQGKYKTYKSNVNFIAIDEFHKCGAKTIAGENLLKLKDRFEYIVPMTGTLLRNKPTDAWLPLTLIDKEHSALSLFKAYYCTMGEYNQVLSYKHLDILQKQIAECSLRRTKKDVMDLPPEIHQNIYVTMNDRQQLIYDEAYNWALDNIDLIVDSPNPLAQLIRLRQATGYTGILSSSIKESAKMDRIEEDVDEIVENEDKVIILSNWTDMTDELQARLSKKYKVLSITGTTVHSGMQVEDIKYKFQNDPEYKILIGTTGKMGTGHTLTAANWVLFLDEPWTMADKQQGADRISRTGQTKTMYFRTYITKDTIDERVNRIVENKGNMADYVIDNKIIGDKQHVVKFLLGIEE